MTDVMPSSLRRAAIDAHADQVRANKEAQIRDKIKADFDLASNQYKQLRQIFPEVPIKMLAKPKGILGSITYLYWQLDGDQELIVSASSMGPSWRLHRMIGNAFSNEGFGNREAFNAVVARGTSNQPYEKLRADGFQPYLPAEIQEWSQNRWR